MRKLQGKSGDPQEGDKVICLKNNWDIYSDGDNPLVNGTIGYLKNVYNTFLNIPPSLSSDRKTKQLKLINADFISDTEEDYGNLTMDKEWFTSGESGLDYKTSYNMGRNWRFKTAIPEQFTYGYAITTHKAQGSE